VEVQIPCCEQDLITGTEYFSLPTLTCHILLVLAFSTLEFIVGGENGVRTKFGIGHI